MADGREAEGPEPTPQEREWLARPEVERALRVVRVATKGRRARVHPRDNIELDLGLDSVERVELLGALQREFGADVKDWSSLQVFTVRETVDAVFAHAGASGGGAAGPTWDAIFRAGIVWWLVFRLVRLVARVFYRLRVTGTEKLPERGPYIISPNHESYMDGPVVIAALPFRAMRNLFYVGTSEVFGAGIMRDVARSLRLIPIDPDVNMVSAMKAGAYGLANGRILLLFPEGERSIDGEPKTFKKGAAILAAHLGVPIVPVALRGFHKAWPRGRSLRPFGRLRVAFGDPIFPPERAAGDAAYAAMTADLKARVVAMRARFSGG